MTKEHCTDIQEINSNTKVPIKASLYHYQVSKKRFKRLIGKWSITKSALTNFFNILEQKQIPRKDLGLALNEIARNHNALLSRLAVITSNDPLVQQDRIDARHAIEVGDYSRAEALLTQAEARDLEAIEQLETLPTTQQAAIIQRKLSAAETNVENGQLQKIQFQYRKAADYYLKAVKLVPEGNKKAIGLCLNEAGMALYYAGDYTSALPLYKQALQIFESALGSSHPDVTTMLKNLAFLYEAMEDLNGILSLCERAPQIYESEQDSTQPSATTTLNNLATSCKKINGEGSTLSLVERALRISEMALGIAPPDIETKLDDLIDFYTEIEEPAIIIIPLAERALRIGEITLGLVHPDVVTMLHTLSILHRDTGEYEKALSSAQRALEISETTEGVTCPSTVAILLLLSDLYKEIGEKKKALSLAQRALQLQEQEIDDLFMPHTLRHLAKLYQDMGELMKALPLYNRALQIDEAELRFPHQRRLIMPLNNLAGLYEKIGKYAKALSLLERAEAIGLKESWNSHPDMKLVRKNIQRIREKMSKNLSISDRLRIKAIKLLHLFWGYLTYIIHNIVTIIHP